MHGLDPMAFQWRRDGTNLINSDRISGVTSPLLQFNTTEFDDSGDYDLIVSNSAGSITGFVAQLTVTPIVAWGENFSDQLDVPTGTSNVVAISAGGTHSLALTSDGRLVAWGDNTHGQRNIPATTNVISISAGDNHNLILTSDGNIVAWGDNRYGQCNVPASATNIIAVAAGAYNSFGLRSNGTLVAWPGTFIPPSATNVIAIDSSASGFLALRADGSAVGSFSISPDWTNLVAVASGRMLGLGLRADGTVLTSLSGWVNISIPQMNTIAISAGDYHALTLDADGTVRGWGETNSWQTGISEFARNVIAISAGGTHSLALVQVSTNLNLITHPEDQSVESGTSIDLNASVTGRGPVRYQWYFDNSLIATATNANHSFISDLSKVGEYFVVVSNPWSSITSSVASVSIPAAPNITVHPQSQTVTPGTTVLFNAEAEGSTPLSYQWRFNGNNLTGETTSVLQLLSVTADHSGDYTIQVTISTGTATSEPAKLKVIVPSALNFDFSSGSPLLSFDGTGGASYVIQYTTNLASSNWLDLITLSNSPASYHFIDTNASTNGARFYRAVGN